MLSASPSAAQARNSGAGSSSNVDNAAVAAGTAATVVPRLDVSALQSSLAATPLSPQTAPTATITDRDHDTLLPGHRRKLSVEVATPRSPMSAPLASVSFKELYDAAVAEAGPAASALGRQHAAGRQRRGAAAHAAAPRCQRRQR